MVVDVVQLRTDALGVTSMEVQAIAGRRSRSCNAYTAWIAHLAYFDLAAARLQWLRQLALRSTVWAASLSTLWEAFVNTIAFQHVSLQAATRSPAA